MITLANLGTAPVIRGTVTLLNDLPRYEVLLEKAKQCPEFDASACYAFLHLLKTSDELLALDNQFLERLGTRQGRFALLMTLHKTPEDSPPTAAELAQSTGVTRATMSGFLDGLEREGVIERRTDPRDRRVIRVHLTVKGSEFAERLGPLYCKWFTSVLQSLTVAEREHLVYLLEKIQNRLADLSREIQPPADAA
jgi:DNA-binding MarR family transcriptional regulator